MIRIVHVQTCIWRALQHVIMHAFINPGLLIIIHNCIHNNMHKKNLTYYNTHFILHKNSLRELTVILLLFILLSIAAMKSNSQYCAVQLYYSRGSNKSSTKATMYENILIKRYLSCKNYDCENCLYGHISSYIFNIISI